MANYIILSPDGLKAKKDFTAILDQPDETIVLILWDDDTAKAANRLVKKIADDKGGDSGFNEFVNFVIATDPGPIIPELKKLDNSSGVNLDNLDDYVIVSISPFRNIISECVTKKRFMKGKGSVNTAIVAAIANK